MSKKEHRGQILRFFRGERPQKEIADKAKMAVHTLALYESGQRAPREDTWKKLITALEVPDEELEDLEQQIQRGLDLDKEEDVCRYRVRQLELRKLDNPEARSIWNHKALMYDNARIADLLEMTRKKG